MTVCLFAYAIKKKANVILPFHTKIKQECIDRTKRKKNVVYMLDESMKMCSILRVIASSTSFHQWMTSTYCIRNGLRLSGLNLSVIFFCWFFLFTLIRVWWFVFSSFLVRLGDSFVHLSFVGEVSFCICVWFRLLRFFLFSLRT